MGQLEEGGDAEHVLDLRNEVVLAQAEHVHGHFAGVEVHAQGDGGLEQFVQRRDLAAAHHAGHQLRAQAGEVQPAQRQVLPPAHHEVEGAVQQPLALEAAAGFLLDDVQAPEGEEHVDLVVHRRGARGQGEDGDRLVEIPAHADEGQFFLFRHMGFSLSMPPRLPPRGKAGGTCDYLNAQAKPTPRESSDRVDPSWMAPPADVLVISFSKTWA